ncbi:MAG: ABC transporter permease [Actinobacteria bacterium]|nr:ABC transporter permease [Actinomycetota bacterium]
MGFLEYLRAPSNRSVLYEQALEHVALTAAAVAIAIVVGMALGIVAHRNALLRPPIVNTTATLLTVPSLALFALLIPIVGIGFKPALIALAMYALLPIVRNTVSGLGSVDPAVTESARGMGLSARQRLLRIELPNAWPVILAGVRVATQLTVGIAAIAALVGGPGLGREIFRGIRSIGSPFALNSLLGGTLGIIVVAVAFDLLYTGIGRLTTPRGIR